MLTAIVLLLLDSSNLFPGILSGLIVLIAFQVTSFYLKVRKYPPGPTPLPFIGNILLFRQSRHVHEIICDLKEKFGPVVTVWFGHIPQVIILDPQESLSVLKSKSFAGRPSFSLSHEFLFKAESNSIGLGDFSQGWQVLRRVAYAAVRRYANSPVLPEHVCHVVDSSVEMMMRQKRGINIKEEFVLMIMALVCTSAFGKKVNRNHVSLKRIKYAMTAFEAENTVFFIVGFAPIFKYFMWPQLQRLLRIHSIIKSVIRREFEEHEEKFNQKSNQKDDGDSKDFIDALLTASAEADPESVKYLDRWSCMNTVIDFFFAGTETTRTILRWTVLLMCLKQEMQIRMRREVYQVLTDIETMPSLKMKESTPFTFSFILEVLRFRTLLPFSVAHKTMEETSVFGYKIPAGTTVAPALIQSHQDKTIWTDPETFNPERFMENGKANSRPNPHFVPFSTGRRSCIGEKLALSNLYLIVIRIIQRTRGFLFVLDDLPSGLTRDQLLYGDINKVSMFAPIISHTISLIESNECNKN